MTGYSGRATTNLASPDGDGVSGSKPPAGDGGGDPSMEDILASIRRILNEDEAPPGQPASDGAPDTPAAAPAFPLPAPVGDGADEGGDDGVLVLDEAMLVPTEAEAPPPVPEPVIAAFALPQAVMAPPQTESPSGVDHTADASGGLMAPESTAAAAASVGSLLRTLSQERTTQVYRGGPTIEDLVREEVRPLLKDWLDQHLPPLVERLVRQEIERVAGRATL